MPKKLNKIKIHDFSTEAFSIRLPSYEIVEKLKQDLKFNINYDLFLKLTEISRQIYSHKILVTKKPNNSDKQEIFMQISLLTKEIINHQRLLQEVLTKAGQIIRGDILAKIKAFEKKIKHGPPKNKNKRLLLSEIEDDLKSDQLTLASDLESLPDRAYCLKYLNSPGDRLAYLHRISNDLLAKLKKHKGGRKSSFALKKTLPSLIKIFNEGTGKKPDCYSSTYSDNGYTGIFFNFMISFNSILIEIDKKLTLGTNRTIGKTISKYLAQQKSISLPKREEIT